MALSWAAVLAALAQPSSHALSAEPRESDHRAEASIARTGHGNRGGTQPRAARLGGLLSGRQCEPAVAARGRVCPRTPGAVCEQEDGTAGPRVAAAYVGVLPQPRRVRIGGNRDVVQGNANSGTMKDLGKPG